MEENKPFYLSKTIVGASITLIACLGGIFGFTVDIQTQSEIVTLIVGAVGSILSIYGRIKASKTIKITK